MSEAAKNGNDAGISPVHHDDGREGEDGKDRIKFTPVRLTKSHNISEKGMLKDELLHETKYVMLNFMSLVPRKLYKDHVYPSPDLAKPGPGDKFSKSMSHLSKSKSFDVVTAKRHKSSKLSRMQTLEKETGSAASEDNVNYRYKINQMGLNETQGTNSVHSVQSESEHHSEHVTKSKSVYSVEASSSSSETSPRKPPTSINRLYSDTSSIGDFSYYSDADDEYEVSHSSSRFSAASVNQYDGFLDLRKRPKHTMARSVSDFDEVDPVPYKCSDTIAECQNEDDDDDKTGSRESSYIMSSQGSNHGNGDDGLDEADGFPFSLPFRSRMDRSKLKLDIPQQPVMLDDVMLSLQSELNSELSEMESEYEEVIRSACEASQPNPCLTPTQAAKILARIGDEVANEYSYQISNTISQLFFNRVGELTYQQFKDISKVMVDNKLPGWRQVALLMVYGQSAAWYAVEGGHKNIGSIIDHCSRLVFDVAAEFIIKEGGWGAVMNFDPSQSSDTQSSDFESPVVDFFTSHNVTQVESGSTNEDIDGDTNIPVSDNNIPIIDTNIPVVDTIDGKLQHSTFLETQHSEVEVDFLAFPGTESGQGLIHSTIHSHVTQVSQLSVLDQGEGDSTNQSHLFLPGDRSHIYKPSLGFDFRTVSTASDGSSLPHPSSDTSLDYVEGQRTTDVNEEEVFDDCNGNADERVSEVIDNSNGGEANTRNIEPKADQQESENTQTKYHSKTLGTSHLAAHPGSRFDGKLTDIATEIGDNYRDKELHKKRGNQIGDVPIQLGEEVEMMHYGTVRQPIETPETLQELSTANQGPSDSLIGNLGGRGTKLVLFAGAAAAVGLGLKFGFFNK